MTDAPDTTKKQQRERLTLSGLDPKALPRKRALLGALNDLIGLNRALSSLDSARPETEDLSSDPDLEPIVQALGKDAGNYCDGIGNVFWVHDDFRRAARGEEGRLGLLERPDFRAGSGTSALELSSGAAAILAGGLPASADALKPWLSQPDVAPFAAVVAQVGRSMDYAAYDAAASGAKVLRALKDHARAATGMDMDELCAAAKEGGARAAAALNRITGLQARFYDVAPMPVAALAGDVLAAARIAPLLQLRLALAEVEPLPERAALAALAVGWAFKTLNELERASVSAMLVMLGGGVPLREGEYEHPETDNACAAFEYMGAHTWAGAYQSVVEADEADEKQEVYGFSHIPAPRVSVICEALCAVIDLQIAAGGGPSKARRDQGLMGTLASVLEALEAGTGAPAAHKSLSAALRLPTFGAQSAIAFAWFVLPSAADLLSSRSLLPDAGRLLTLTSTPRDVARRRAELLLDAQRACVFSGCVDDKGPLGKLKGMFEMEFTKDAVEAAIARTGSSARARWLLDSATRAAQRAFVQRLAAPLADIPTAGLIQRTSLVLSQFKSGPITAMQDIEEVFVILLAERADLLDIGTFDNLEFDDDYDVAETGGASAPETSHSPPPHTSPPPSTSVTFTVNGKDLTFTEREIDVPETREQLSGQSFPNSKEVEKIFVSTGFNGVLASEVATKVRKANPTALA